MRSLRGIAATMASMLSWSVLAQFSAIVDGERLDGATGFVAQGTLNSHAGRWVAPAGDLNHDGIDDLAIGAFMANYTTAEGQRVLGGAGHVVYGRADGDFPRDLVAMRPDQGFTVHFTSGQRQRVARSIGHAGDFNGDGLDDLVVTAGEPILGGPEGGALLVVIFGRADAWPPNLDVGELAPDEAVVFEAPGEPTWNRVAIARAAGDVNADGLDDLIIASPYANNGGGRVFVVFGSDRGLPERIDLTTLDGTNGFALEGEAFPTLEQGPFAGTSIAGLGDVNGDGVDDVGLGAPGYTPGGVSYQGVGEAFVVYGRRDGTFPPVLRLADLDAADGFTFARTDQRDNPWNIGAAIAGAGDMNGDGIGDLAIAAPLQFREAPASVYILYGRRDFPAVVTPASVHQGTGVVVVEPVTGPDQLRMGYSLAPLSDLDGDGFSDLLVGAPAGIGRDRSFVIFGGDMPARICVSELDGRNGLSVFGSSRGEQLGYSVAGVGDINGDGHPDLAIGARLGMFTGLVYVLYGGSYCRVDFNTDGSLDFYDVLDFIDAFAMADGSAVDWNQDGRRSLDDFHAFLDDFLDGCP